MHNQAADLYNAGDANGCYRMFQGGLYTARPLLAHRPDIQQLIDQGLQSADRQASLAARAKSLHETIETVASEVEADRTGQAGGQPDAAAGPDGRHTDVAGADVPAADASESGADVTA